jgi:hypothetical protein
MPAGEYIESSATRKCPHRALHKEKDLHAANNDNYCVLQSLGVMTFFALGTYESA